MLKFKLHVQQLRLRRGLHLRDIICLHADEGWVCLPKRRLLVSFVHVRARLQLRYAGSGHL